MTQINASVVSSGVFSRQNSRPRDDRTQDLDVSVDVLVESDYLKACEETAKVTGSGANFLHASTLRDHFELEEGFTESARFLKTQKQKKPSMYERFKRYCRIKLYSQESLADFHRTSDVYI